VFIGGQGHLNLCEAFKSWSRAKDLNLIFI